MNNRNLSFFFSNIEVELARGAGIFSVNIDPRIREGSYLQSRFEWKSGVHRRDTNGDREIHRMIVKAIRHLGGIPSLGAIIPNRISSSNDYAIPLSLSLFLSSLFKISGGD